MSDHLRSAEDVAREVLGDCATDDTEEFCRTHQAEMQMYAPHCPRISRAADVIRAYAAEVREAARAEALAGFEWEPDDCSLEFRTHGQNCQCFGPRSGPEVGRWVGPREPTP